VVTLRREERVTMEPSDVIDGVAWVAAVVVLCVLLLAA
jgi:hypothetical protein